MATFVRYLVVLLAGCFSGLALTALVLELGLNFSTVAVGPWKDYSGQDIHEPYRRAALAVTGEIPLAKGEGTSFIATHDSDGRRLDPACDYLFTGPISQGRFWTLTRLSTEGFPFSDHLRQGFTSSEILRNNIGNFDIILSRHARPGNWLPLSDAPFVLLLRLYDNELYTIDAALTAPVFPQLIRTKCA
ncbi:DUF1214 domain-containing protein [Beijerinckia mobilis]|uniref:DUF1214 domain-containing protein n=1 Tax=Beijerinckia mobilis TaxID=231434 RepID=UPI00055166B8|nr:DUF1214 domain-containing protein [Beijerinckia mobilis]